MAKEPQIIQGEYGLTFITPDAGTKQEKTPEQFEAERQANRIVYSDVVKEFFNGNEEACRIAIAEYKFAEMVAWSEPKRGRREAIYLRSTIAQARDRLLSVAKALR